MHYLVVTDIADPRRLRKAARVCERWGERMQNSVYLMELDTVDLKHLQTAMVKIFHASEDSARYYALCGSDIARSSGEGLGRGLRPNASHWII